MPAKVSKKVKPKRKQVKKTIKRKVQQNHNPYNTSTEQNIPNNLRQQLFARGLFGYNPQQYGNINNQRRIDQIKQDNQTIAQEINDYKTTIDSLRKEKDESKSELKKIKTDYDKQKAELDSTRDKLAEATRVETETNRLRAQQQNLTQQLAETNSENTIIQYKTKNATIESSLNQEQLRNIELKRKMQENELYQRGKKLSNEYLTLLNENNGLVQAMSDPAFLQPNEAIKATFKNLETEKARRKLLEEQRKKQEEYQLIKLQQDSMPTEDELAPYAQQIAANIKETDEKIRQTREAMYPHQKKVDEYNADLARRDELDKQGYQLDIDKMLLQAQSEKLTDELRKPLSKYIKSKMAIVAQQDINNIKTKHRIDLSNKALEIRENNALQEEKLSQLKNIGVDEEGAKMLGEAEAANELAKEQIRSTNEQRQASYQLAKAQARRDYAESPEVKAAVQNIVNAEYATQRNIEAAHYADIAAKAKIQRQKAELATQLKQQALDEDLPLVQQITTVENELTDKYTELGKKDEIIDEILALKRQYPERWVQFVQTNPTAELTSRESAENRPEGELKGILDGFKYFLNKNPPESITITDTQPAQPVSQEEPDYKSWFNGFTQQQQQQPPPQLTNNIVIEEEEERSELDDFTK